MATGKGHGEIETRGGEGVGERERKEVGMGRQGVASWSWRGKDWLVDVVLRHLVSINILMGRGEDGEAGGGEGDTGRGQRLVG